MEMLIDHWFCMCQFNWYYLFNVQCNRTLKHPTNDNIESVEFDQIHNMVFFRCGIIAVYFALLMHVDVP